MSTYAIGDIQGCYRELSCMLDKINFNTANDRLCFVGDLVNRGPQSLEVLNFIRSLGDNAVTVLGNHDLHLLGVVEGTAKLKSKDTLQNIIDAPEMQELILWLRRQPLLLHESELGFVIGHAGLPPQWDVQQAMGYADEVSQTLMSDDYADFLAVMCGNQPAYWQEDLAGYDRLRYIVNGLTRMRYCYTDGRLNFTKKYVPELGQEEPKPWFMLPNRRSIEEKIVFGHWSTLHLGGNIEFQQYNVFPIDTGCVWGGGLTALRLEDQTLFRVPSQ